jgi:dTDP-4-dehydrorhamnose 3,5-epimerase
MEIQQIDIEGPLVIKPNIFEDDRGHFFEPYNRKRFFEAGISEDFVQDNQSLSHQGAVRGLHFQAPPHAQGKLVRVITGAVLDVIVDIRKKSPTYGKAFSIELNSDNQLMLWVPVGFAHGFSTLLDHTIFQYKCTGYYNKPSEGGILWNDEDLAINWQVSSPILSDKDKLHPSFKHFNSPF